MQAKEIFIVMTIYFLVPLTGLILFILILRKMKRDNIINAPAIELFIVFGTYGGLLLNLLTTLFWQWSGMASLGTFYLLFGAPIAMILIAYRQNKMRGVSKYHYWTYYAGILYFFIALFMFSLLYFMVNK